VELASEFNATVNADLRVGALEETITVTGESPIVDVQSARRQRTLDSELVQSLPTAKGYAGLMVLIPSMVQSGGGVPNVQLSPGMVVFGGRGGRADLQPGVHTGRSVAGAEHGADRTNREDHGAVRLLTSWWLVVGGIRSEPTTDYQPPLTTNHQPASRRRLLQPRRGDAA
jgi:hypothetical protein